MADKSWQLNKGLLWLVIIVICLGLVTAGLVNLERIEAEQANQTLGIMADYDELKRCANAQGITFADVARKAYKAGATGLIVRERILDDWVKAGEINLLQGNELLLNINLGVLTAPQLDWQIDKTATYILTENTELYDQLFYLLDAKKRHPRGLKLGQLSVIEANLYSGELSFLGVGYPTEDLQAAADLGMSVIPRVRNWAPVNQAGIQAEGAWLAAIPGLAGIGFNDESLPGGDNPNALEYLATEIKSLNVPIVSFEFYGQAGFESLAALLDNQVLRAHAIADNELKKYSVVQAVDRFRLAASERNIRLIYLRFFGMDQPVAALEPNLEYIKEVKAGLLAEDFEFGVPKLLMVPILSFISKFLIGLSVIAAGAWLMAEFLAPLFKSKYLILYSILIFLLIPVWAIALLKLPVLAVKLAALSAAIVFPSLAILQAFKQDLLDGPGRQKSLKTAVFALLKMSLFSFVGAIIMSALLRDSSFMLKLDSFVGVKMAHLIPLLLIPVALWLRERQAIKVLWGVAASSVRFWQLAVAAILLAAVGIYILRTGNTGVGSVSSIELQFRQLLDTFLGVRPRTKEFAIGHPMMLILLYYGYRFSMFPILLLAIVGQVSLINTYAHIHTPLLVSVFRSFNGLWLGIMIGCIAIVLINRLLSIFTTGIKEHNDV